MSLRELRGPRLRMCSRRRPSCDVSPEEGSGPRGQPGIRGRDSCTSVRVCAETCCLLRGQWGGPTRAVPRRGCGDLFHWSRPGSGRASGPPPLLLLLPRDNPLHLPRPAPTTPHPLPRKARSHPAAPGPIPRQLPCDPVFPPSCPLVPSPPSQLPCDLVFPPRCLLVPSLPAAL